VTGYFPWYERERRQFERPYQASYTRRSGIPFDPLWRNDPEDLGFSKQLDPPDCWYRKPVAAYSYASARESHAALRAIEPHDIDLIVARLLEGYRILDELFNPRSVCAPPREETASPRSESASPGSD